MEFDVVSLVRSEKDSLTSSEKILSLINSINQRFTFPEFTANLKSELSAAIVDCLKSEKSLFDLKLSCVSLCRILSRDRTNLESLFTADLVESLANLAGYLSDPIQTSEMENHKVKVEIEAKKSLCNANFHSGQVRDNFLNLRCFQSLCRNLAFFSVRSPNDEHDISPELWSKTQDRLTFDVRCFFIITARCAQLRKKSYKQLNALHSFTLLIENYTHEEVCSKNASLLSDMLKALFNVAVNFRSDSLSETERLDCNRLTDLCRQLLCCKVTDDGLNQLENKEMEVRTNAINILTVMPTVCYEFVTVRLSPDCDVTGFDNKDMTAFDSILDVLNGRIDSDSRDDKDLLVPILSLLIDLSRRNRYYRKYLRMKVLPPLASEVNYKPEEGDALRNKLVRLMTSIGTVSQVSAHFLFELCKQSVDRMIKYTGYGNAAGLLANYGMLTGNPDRDPSSESEHSDTEEYENLKHRVNPVAGCVEEPRANPMEGMSEEQKEFEAMKLVEKIDKLMKHGVIKPATVGDDGHLKEVEHVLELQKGHENDDQVETESDRST